MSLEIVTEQDEYTKPHPTIKDTWVQSKTPRKLTRILVFNDSCKLKSESEQYNSGKPEKININKTKKLNAVIAGCANANYDNGEIDTTSYSRLLEVGKSLLILRYPSVCGNQLVPYGIIKEIRGS